MLCNGMLGSLAKWLRILGVNAAYGGCEEDDDALIRRAREEERVLLTKDKGICQSTKKTEGVRIVYIGSKDLDTQVSKVLETLGIEEGRALSRCIVCNRPLEGVGKEKVEGKVPPRIYDSYDRFLQCPRCGRIYWPGTHYENMMEKVSDYIDQ